jgi:hypothetical protein
MSNEEWMAQFEKARLPNESFHHTDHVKMAFLYLEKYSSIEALARFSEALKRFAEAHGKADRYHETVTWAFVLLIQERMARTERPGSWEAFAAGNADLLERDNHILKKYYRPETLRCTLSKKIFVFPDNF